MLTAAWISYVTYLDGDRAMASFNEKSRAVRSCGGGAVLHFTPAEWRAVLEDRGFLANGDNRFESPRRLMGVPVEIVPDHRFG
jgi:hypothetical protein